MSDLTRAEVLVKTWIEETDAWISCRELQSDLASHIAALMADVRRDALGEAVAIAGKWAEPWRIRDEIRALAAREPSP